MIDENFILLDSESTVCTFHNRKLLKNIRVHSGGKSAEVHTNGGTQTSVLVADYTTLDIPVWLNDESLANILSLAVVRKKFRVTMDTDIMPAIHVHLPDGSIMNFHEMSNGLYCHDIRGTTKPSIPSYSFLNTVENNLKLYTRREQLMANKARILYRNSPFPGPQRFVNLLDRHYFRNCPVTSTDAKRAIHIWGKDLAYLQGKTTRSRPTHVIGMPPVPVPQTIRDLHTNVTLCVDFFYVQGLVFLLTVSRNLKFHTVGHVKSRSKRTMVEGINRTRNMYTSRGFVITNIHADPEFNCIREAMMPSILNLAAAREHVGEVERNQDWKRGFTVYYTYSPIQAYPHHHGDKYGHCIIFTY